MLKRFFAIIAKRAALFDDGDRDSLLKVARVASKGASSRLTGNSSEDSDDWEIADT
jgi:hypothetical protein